MTGPEHYRQAEHWLAEADERSSAEASRLCLMGAQVHATLAHAAATADAARLAESRPAWAAVHP